MNQVIDWRAVRKTYNGRLVLDVDGISLAAGEVLVISGPNGAGKSTLIRLISLVEDADRESGAFYLFGKAVKKGDRLSLRRRLAVVWQEPFIFKRSVFDNIAMGLRWRKLSAQIVAERVEAAAELLDITYLGDPARELSRGQAQRVALARALVLEPDLLLLDEPLSVLDTAARDKLLAGLKLRLRAEGRSAIYVTHGKEEAAALADKTVRLSRGRLA